MNLYNEDLEYRIEDLLEIIKENDNLRDDEEVRFQSLALRKAVNDNEPEYIILELVENLEELIDTIIKEERKTGGKKLRRKTKKRKSHKGKRPISRQHKRLSKKPKRKSKKHTRRTRKY